MRAPRTYVTDDIDIDDDPENPMTMELFQGENGDWYLSIAPKSHSMRKHCVRITTSGSKQPDVAMAVYRLYEAMGLTGRGREQFACSACCDTGEITNDNGVACYCNCKAGFDQMLNDG